MSTPSFGDTLINLLGSPRPQRTLRRIAGQLGRTQGWVGDLSVDCWSTLHHTIAGYEAMLEAGPCDPKILFGFLVHDLHEVVTGDRPTYLKTDEDRIFERALDDCIYGSFGVHPLNSDQQRSVKTADQLIRQAEGTLIGPPEFEPTIEWGSTAEDRYLSAVRRVLLTWPQPSQCMGPDTPLADHWISELAEQRKRI